MSTYQYNDLANNAVISFNPTVDILYVNGYSPVEFNIMPIESGPNAGCGWMLEELDRNTGASIKTIYLLFSATPDPYNLARFSSDHIIFSGGVALFGDNDATTTTDDDTTVTLNGGDGNDFLVTAGGSQVLNGGNGTDILVTVDRFSSPGPSGTDAFNGGNGVDWLVLEGSNQITQYTANLAIGTGSITSNAGNSSFTISSIENVNGSAANDWIIGDALANELTGGWDGNDTLEGGGGNDTLWGGMAIIMMLLMGVMVVMSSAGVMATTLSMEVLAAILSGGMMVTMFSVEAMITIPLMEAMAAIRSMEAMAMMLSMGILVMICSMGVMAAIHSKELIAIPWLEDWVVTLTLFITPLLLSPNWQGKALTSCSPLFTATAW